MLVRGAHPTLKKNGKAQKPGFFEKPGFLIPNVILTKIYLVRGAHPTNSLKQSLSYFQLQATWNNFSNFLVAGNALPSSR